MELRTVLPDPIPERSSPLLKATFVDEAGATVTDILTATVTLYDVRTGTIINGRTHVDVLASVTAGQLVWRLAANDTPIVTPEFGDELHVALIEWTWTSPQGTASGKHEIAHRVRNFQTV